MKIRNLINAQVIKSYDLTDAGSDYFRSDATLCKAQVHEMLTNLFYAKLACECATMMSEDQPDLTPATHEEAIMWAHNEYGSDDISALTEQALGYNCYEPWETIVELALVMDPWVATQEQYGKLLSYLYDEYTPEEVA